MRIDWSPLDAAMAGRAPVLWWRDDDAVAPTPALDRLIALTEEVGAPLTLAAIPARVTGALAERVARADGVAVAVHGWAHESHAPEGEKNAEFGAHRPLPARMAEAERGLRVIGEAFGPRALPVFIPPWNRMAPDMPEALAQAGYRGLSVHGNRLPGSAPLPRIDAHLDPVDWRGTRSAVDPAALVARVCALLREDAPIGLMTHHLAHDEAVWALVAGLARRLTARGARWAALGDLLETLAGDDFTI